MPQGLHVVHAQDPGIVGDYVILLDCLVGIALSQFGGRPLRHDVRLNGPRCVSQHVFVEKLKVLHMRHDSRANMEVRPQSSDVIKVRMRTDQPANRLVRSQFHNFLNDR